MNLGTLWRSAHNFGADFIFTIGERYKYQSSDTLKAWKHTPLYNYKDFEAFKAACPMETHLVGIEQTSKSRCLSNFVHPERAIYILGAEDDGLPEEVQKECRNIVHISTPMCLNVAVAGSIVMYARSVGRMTQ